MIKEFRSLEDIPEMLAESHQQPVFLLKHSTACPASADAWRAFQSFAKEETQAAFWKVLVRENRDISLKIAEKTGVKHESPQVILIRDGKAVWNISHRDITGQALARQLESSGE